MRALLFTLFLTSYLLGYGQPNDLSMRMSLLDYSNEEIPANLLSSRTAIILRSSDEYSRAQWRTVSQEFHEYFLQMGIDPTFYVHEQDMYANPVIRQSYMRLFDVRDLGNLVILERNAGRYVMSITSNFDQQGFFRNTKAWRETDSTTDALLFKLGLIVKQSDMSTSNFLILTAPEFIEDINFFKGSRLPNYAGILRRQKLGVARFDSLRIDPKLSDEKRRVLQDYNRQVATYNKQLEEIFSNYPFEWEMFSFKDNDYALASGIQHVFQLVQTTGSGAKDFLNYPDHTKETHIISVTPSPLPGDVRLKRLPVETVVFKPYVYQVRADDVYVGREWDADITWQDAVRNFFFTLQRQFEE